MNAWVGLKIIFPQSHPFRFGSLIFHAPGHYFAKLAILTNSRQTRGSLYTPGIRLWALFPFHSPHCCFQTMLYPSWDSCRCWSEWMCSRAMFLLLISGWCLTLQIRIDDCVKALKEYVGNGRTFDYVINDLTDIPIAVSLHGKCGTAQRKSVLPF